jgi:uncharacterized protein
MVSTQIYRFYHSSKTTTFLIMPNKQSPSSFVLPMSSRPPFHLAFPVHDLSAARWFYGSLLGCPEGRSADDWVDFDFYGHQIVAHLSPAELAHRSTTSVDGDAVPTRHFGVVLTVDEWTRAAERLKAAGIAFLIEPHIRLKDKPGEQATMFFLDPSGNAIELKAFADLGALFTK